jgi:predicted nucleic acid-binding protein
MILVDTSVWVGHFRQSNLSLVYLLTNDQVLCHPLVMLEIACGSPPAPRHKTLEYLGNLQLVKTATSAEVMRLIETHHLYESGCGAVDITLLASTLINQVATIWTQDKKLETLAKKFNVCFDPKSI